MKFTEDELQIIEDALIDRVGSFPTSVSSEYVDKCISLRDKIKKRIKQNEMS